MTEYRDYYRILQVHPTAEPEVVQAAYRRLARKYHPDTSHDRGAKMQELNEAYEVLSDQRQRQQYDLWYRRHTSQKPLPATGLSWWRTLIPTVLTLVVLVVLVLDLFRLGIRGFPEITILLLTVGWLVYHFGGFKQSGS